MNKYFLIVVGITILFLGLAINPAIAVNPISSDDEEDCDICPKVSKTHLFRLKSLINRVVNPNIPGKYQKLSESINTLAEMSEEYLNNLSWGFPIICGILLVIFVPLVIFSFPLIIFYYTGFHKIPLLGPLLGSIIFRILVPVVTTMMNIGYGFGCWDFYW